MIIIDVNDGEAEFVSVPGPPGTPGTPGAPGAPGTPGQDGATPEPPIDLTVLFENALA